MISARWAARHTREGKSASSKSSLPWVPTGSALPTIPKPPSSTSWRIAWGSSSWTKPSTSGPPARRHSTITCSSPIHVYTTGDSADLYINDRLISRQTKGQGGQGQYRLRRDDVTYEPGTVRVVAFKNGAEWATATMETAGAPAAITLEADRTTLLGDGRDLSFVKASIVDAEGRMVPTATNSISFSVSGSGELVATDNGDAADRTVFSSATRKAFSGLALAIVRTARSQSGEITVTATSQGLTAGEVRLTAE